MQVYQMVVMHTVEEIWGDLTPRQQARVFYYLLEGYIRAKLKAHKKEGMRNSDLINKASIYNVFLHEVKYGWSPDRRYKTPKKKCLITRPIKIGVNKEGGVILRVINKHAKWVNVDVRVGVTFIRFCNAIEKVCGHYGR